MKRNSAILFALMGGELPPVSPEWAADLFRLARDLGISEVDLFAMAGLSVSKAGDRPASELRSGKGRHVTALKLRHALRSRRVHVPPLVLVGEYDDLEARWARAGAELAAKMPDQFRDILTAVERMAEKLRGHNEAQRAAAALVDNLDGSPLQLTKTPRGNPLPRQGKKTDRSDHYDEGHDSSRTRPVEPPRKPPARPRR